MALNNCCFRWGLCINARASAEVTTPFESASPMMGTAGASILSVVCFFSFFFFAKAGDAEVKAIVSVKISVRTNGRRFIFFVLFILCFG